MKPQLIAPVVSIATFLVPVIGQPVWSFSIVPPPSQSFPKSITVPYQPSDGQLVGDITSWIKPYQKLSVPATNSDFFSTLNSTYTSGWNFTPAANPLTGSFFLGKHYACAPGAGYACGAGIGITKTVNVRQTVGGALSVFYSPGSGDPVVNSDLHWIQVVTSDNGLTKQTFVDNGSLFEFLISQKPPFYPDTAIFSDSVTGSKLLRFLDAAQREDDKTTPGLDDRTLNWDWTGQLFLARELAPTGSTRNVELFNGIQWGWQSIFREAIISSGSGGGGFIPGLTQNNPIVASLFIPHPPKRRPAIGGGASAGGAASGRGQKRGGSTATGGAFGTKVFFDVPAGRWYDPATTYGFEF